MRAFVVAELDARFLAMAGLATVVVAVVPAQHLLVARTLDQRDRLFAQGPPVFLRARLALNYAGLRRLVDDRARKYLRQAKGWSYHASHAGHDGIQLALGLAFRQKGYYPEALREYRLALDHGEDRRLTLQAMAEVHLLRRDLDSALELYDALVEDGVRVE